MNRAGAGRPAAAGVPVVPSGEHLAAAGIDDGDDRAGVAGVVGRPGQHVEAGHAEQADAEPLGQALGRGHADPEAGEEPGADVDGDGVHVAEGDPGLFQGMGDRPGRPTRRADGDRSPRRRPAGRCRRPPPPRPARSPSRCRGGSPPGRLCRSSPGRDRVGQPRPPVGPGVAALDRDRPGRRRRPAEGRASPVEGVGTEDRGGRRRPIRRAPPRHPARPPPTLPRRARPDPGRATSASRSSR